MGNFTIAIAGYRSAGDYWAALAFLEFAEYTIYPTDRMGWIGVYDRIDKLPPFELTGENSYFRTQWGNHLTRGLYQSMLRDIGDPSEGEKNRVISSHTFDWLANKNTEYVSFQFKSGEPSWNKRENGEYEQTSGVSEATQ